MKLLVLDGNSLVNRAFYGIKILTTKDNRPTNAIYGFLNILLNLLRENQPDEVAIAWDLKAPTFRHKMYDGYKATRHGMPDDLAQQMPVLKELLAELGFVMVSREGWEADDLLGTLSAAAATRGDECLLATGDRDSLQLVNEHVTVLLASTRGSRSETVPMDPEAIREKYGLENPRQLIEVKSLMGDTSDNIPGVPGVGEKTALALVQAFGSLDEVYAHLDDPRIKPGVRKKLTENEDKARLSHTLGEIRLDAPIDTAPGAYRRGPGEPEKAAALLASLEMHSLIPRLGLTESAAPAAPAEERTLAAADAPLTGQIFLVALPAGDGWAAVDERGIPFRLEGQALTDLLDSPDAHLWVFDAKPLYHLALAAGDVPVGSVWEGDYKLPVVLKNDARQGERSLADIGDTYLSSSVPGVSVPLRQVADVEPVWSQSKIVHRNGMRCITVSADLKRGVNAMRMTSRINEVLKNEIVLPAGVETELGGAREFDAETIPPIASGLSISLVIIFFFILVNFRKFGITLVIMAAMSLCLFGAMIGLWIADFTIGLTSVLGFITLLGMIVRNVILMYQHAEDKRKVCRWSAKLAAYDAGKRRMVPIFLTTATTAVGVVPMMLGGSTFWAPVGLTIFAGGIGSLILVVTILPVLYSKIYK